MRIAITGSSGLIGTALQASLRADGHQPVPMVRGAQRPGTISWDPAGGRLEVADLEGLDGVVHLAGEGIGEKRWTSEQKARIRDSRLKGTTLLCAAVASTTDQPAVMVSGSAIGYYGDRGDDQLTELSGPGQDFLADLCVAWEAATAPARAAGIRVANIRTGIVLAPQGGVLTRMAPLFRLGLGGRLGSGRQWMSWVSLADEVAAIRFLLDRPVSGPVNVTAPRPVTNSEFTRSLARVLHRPAFLVVPSLGPKLAFGRELAEQLLFASQRVLPEALVDAGFEFRHHDVEPALRAALGKDPDHGS